MYTVPNVLIYILYMVLCYCISLYVMNVRVNKKAQHKSLLLQPNLSSTFCPLRRSLRRIFPRGLFLVRCPEQISFWGYCRAPSSTKHCWMSFFGILAIGFRTTSKYERVRRRWALGNRCSWTLYSRTQQTRFAV